MKKLIVSILVLLFAQFSHAQNLVPNPSFEDTVYCPNTVMQVAACEHWRTLRETPEYFNSCSGLSQVGVPANSYGYQPARTGNGYMGGFSFFNIQNGLREIFGCHLIDPLVIGQKYYVSFYVNMADNINFRTAINKIGVLFATDSTNYNYPNLLPNFAHVYTDSIISDTLNWTFVSGSFIADSAYNFVGIGCFFSFANIDTLNLLGNASHSYYFYDDICVSADSLTCFVTTDVNEINNEDVILVYPNPFNEVLNISCKENELCEIFLYDITSRKLLYQEFKNAIELSTAALANGIYFYEVKNKSGTTKTGKIIKR